MRKKLKIFAVDKDSFMFLAGIAAALVLLGPSVKATPTSPAICSLLQTAYSNFERDGRVIYPPIIKAAPYKMSDMSKIAASYREAMKLTDGEFQDLMKIQSTSPHGPFVPSCPWKGQTEVAEAGVGTGGRSHTP
ncbi:hypothetical protein [Sphingomonas aerolata]|uniref:hypothetical protein n=1 Tax=Sphingomonas aerolata TaxID=185951 RepID=UPI002FDF0E20